MVERRMQDAGWKGAGWRASQGTLTPALSRRETGVLLVSRAMQQQVQSADRKAGRG